MCPHFVTGTENFHLRFEGELIPGWPVADIWGPVTHEGDKARAPQLSASVLDCFGVDIGP